MRAQPFKVLVVDDDMNFRDLLQTLLEAEGYKVECAASFGERRRRDPKRWSLWEYPAVGNAAV